MPLSAAQIDERMREADQDLKSRMRQLKQVVRILVDERDQFIALGLTASLPAAAGDPIHSGSLPSTKQELLNIDSFIKDLSSLLLNDGSAPTLTSAQRKAILDRYA